MEKSLSEVWVNRLAEAFGEVRVITEEEWAMLEGTGFQVTEEFALGDLSEVKEDRQTVPAASNVLLRVQAASQRTSKDGSIKSVAVQLNLINGVEVADPTSGTVVVKYQNKALFADLPYWVDTGIRTATRYTGKNQAFKVPLKQFLAALGYDLKSPPKLNDEFYGAVVGRELVGDVKLTEIRVKNPVSQSWEGTGEFRNEVRNFRSA